MASPLSDNESIDDSGPESPSSPSLISIESPLGTSDTSAPAERPQAAPSSSSPLSGMTTSSTPLGPTSAARRPMQSSISSKAGLTRDIQDKMRAFQLSRQGAPPRAAEPGGPTVQQSGPAGVVEPVGTVKTPLRGPGGVPAGFQMPGRPMPQPSNSSPAVPGANKPSLAQKRGQLNLGGLPGTPPAPAGRKKPGLSLKDLGAGAGAGASSGATQEGGEDASNDPGGSLMDKYAKYIDKKTGSLRFKGKAELTPGGVKFEGGTEINISLDEVDTLDELGKGNYGTVYKVRHSRPRMRRPGQGLAGNKSRPNEQSPASSASPTTSSFAQRNADGTTGVIMAMKELRLELEDSKFAAIIMELDILHRCVSPFIIEFYGAFFQEGAVYICIEFMDGGSIDKLYGGGVPESILRKVTLATTMGLRSLKDQHNIIHRDVKPTNILVNTKGQIKICDFGVSGNLVASIAKTNIGCQSYMAPERIAGGGVAQAGANAAGGTYSVQSDIWSLGLSIIECALGRYPYPPETYDNIFSQLSAIVDGDPPDLPSDEFSEAAHDFVQGCLMKIPKLRPTYSMLLQHAWLAPLLKPATISEEDEEAAEAGATMPTGGATGVAPGTMDPTTGSTEDEEVANWVKGAMERRANGKMAQSVQPALHAAPLDAVSSPTKEAP